MTWTAQHLDRLPPPVRALPGLCRLVWCDRANASSTAGKKNAGAKRDGYQAVDAIRRACEHGDQHLADLLREDAEVSEFAPILAMLLEQQGFVEAAAALRAAAEPDGPLVSLEQLAASLAESLTMPGAEGEPAAVETEAPLGEQLAPLPTEIAEPVVPELEPEPPVDPEMVEEPAAEATEEVAEPDPAEAEDPTEDPEIEGEEEREDGWQGLSARRGDGKRLRFARMPLRLDRRHVEAIDRALAVLDVIDRADDGTDKTTRIKRVGDALRADGFDDLLTQEGFLLVPVDAARTGGQTYSDGTSTWVENRPDAEVEASLPTYALRPFTNDHPSEMVTPRNANRYARGSCGQDAVLSKPREDGYRYVQLTVGVWDAATLRAIKGGKHELSAGYTTDIVEESGKDAKGVKFDYVQTNIIINHLALVARGRAGPLARLNLDGAAWPQDDPIMPPTNDQASDASEEEDVMSGEQEREGADTKADQVDVEVDGVNVKMSKADAELITAARSVKTDESASVRSDLAAAQGTIVALERRVKIREDEAASARCDALRSRVRPMCPTLNLDAAGTEIEIMTAVVLDLAPDYKGHIESMRADTNAADLELFVRAIFDREISAAASRGQNLTPSPRPAPPSFGGGVTLDNLNELANRGSYGG